jgi:hypothetical protein
VEQVALNRHVSCHSKIATPFFAYSMAPVKVFFATFQRGSTDILKTGGPLLGMLVNFALPWEAD